MSSACRCIPIWTSRRRTASSGAVLKERCVTAITVRGHGRRSLFDFDLPEERIALGPPPRAIPRGCWWCVKTAAREHRSVRDLPELSARGDALVVNDTKVIPARLHGARVWPATRQAQAQNRDHFCTSAWRSDRFPAFARPRETVEAGRPLDAGQ